MVQANNLLCDIEHNSFKMFLHIMQKHFETTQEMVNRGMVGVEAWLTEMGLVTHGSPAETLRISNPLNMDHPSV